MWAWSCSFTKHELHLRVTAKCCKSFFLALKTRFTPLQSFSCACKLYLRLQSYVHFHKSYHTHANLLGVKLPSYTSFLTDRQQVVRLGKFSSSTRTISTGAPHGCVLSPLLFSLYTNDCTSKDPSVKLLKFADDTTLIGLIQDGDEST